MRSASVFSRSATWEKALKAAIREAATGQPDRLIRLGKEYEAEMVFAVVRETKHDDGSVTYQQETRISLDRKGESAHLDGELCRVAERAVCLAARVDWQEVHAGAGRGAGRRPPARHTRPSVPRKPRARVVPSADGDSLETEGGKRKSPRRTGGLTGAGKGI